MTAYKSLLFNWFGVFLVTASSCAISTAGELTPEQVAKVRQKIAELRDTVDGRASDRNLSAGEVFMAASKDPKAAVALFLRCNKEVKFDLENRKESDYRAWRDGMDGRVKDDQFVEALQIQLRYLAITCKAAEVEDFAQVFAPLMDFVDGLSRLEEMPDGMLMQSVDRTIFAEAYYLESLFEKNEAWEAVPYNINGIYEKAILPYLRRKKPEALINAWDRRIEQQLRVVAFVEEQNEKELRGKDRDQEVKIRTRQNSRGGILKGYDPEMFARETLPQLKWDRLVDSYEYVDEVMGAKALLDFLVENLKHPKSAEWLGQLEKLIGAAEAKLELADDVPPTPELGNGADPNGFD